LWFVDIRATRVSGLAQSELQLCELRHKSIFTRRHLLCADVPLPPGQGNERRLLHLSGNNFNKNCFFPCSSLPERSRWKRKGKGGQAIPRLAPGTLVNQSAGYVRVAKAQAATGGGATTLALQVYPSRMATRRGRRRKRGRGRRGAGGKGGGRGSG
jgi:hypothetical protein